MNQCQTNIDSLRKYFQKKDVLVIDKGIFSFDDIGDDDNGDLNETIKSIIDNLLLGKDFQICCFSKKVMYLR